MTQQVLCEFPMELSLDEGDKTLMVYVTHMSEKKPDMSSWSSPDDYYGYREIEYDLYDTYGQKWEPIELGLNPIDFNDVVFDAAVREMIHAQGEQA